MAALSPEARVGNTVANKYRLVSLLGKGGMGAVFEAEHLVTGRRGALKLMHVSEAWSEVAVERFLREARIVGSVNHPNIVEVLDAGVEENGAPYAVFTLLRGETVRNLLMRRGKLTVPQALHVAVEVLDGLGAAHSRGVVHRDIKPDNVFIDVSPKGKYGVRILDFGISKMTDESEDQKTLTKTGTAIGTSYYMSPEQIAGDARLDARADIFSLGAMLYRMLSGKFPFDGTNANMVMMSVLTKPARPLKDLDPTLPVALCDAVHCAIHKDREQRFASAADMIHALQEIQRSLGAPAPDWASVVQVPAGAADVSSAISRSGPSPRASISNSSASMEPGLVATTPARAVSGTHPFGSNEASGQRNATAMDGTPMVRADVKGDTLSATVTPSRGDAGAALAMRAPRSRAMVVIAAAAVVSVLGVSSLFAVRSFRTAPAAPPASAPASSATQSGLGPSPAPRPASAAATAHSDTAPVAIPTAPPLPSAGEVDPAPSAHATTGHTSHGHSAHGTTTTAATTAPTAAPAVSPPPAPAPARPAPAPARTPAHSRGPITDFDEVAPQH